MRTHFTNTHQGASLRRWWVFSFATALCALSSVTVQCLVAAVGFAPTSLSAESPEGTSVENDRSSYEPEVHGRDEAGGGEVEKPKKIVPTPRPVVASFNSIQTDLKATCPLLLKDGQLEVFRTLLEPYVDDQTCKTCRAFARVWWGVCRIPPIKKVIAKKKTKKQLDEEADVPEEEPTPVPTPRPLTSAATPATELLEIFSRLSRQLANNVGVQGDLKNLFASFEYKAPVTAKLYISTLTTYFISAWPEPANEDAPGDVQPEAKKADLNGLF